MPIKFRCTHCQQFLGISRSKASTLTDCPTCGRTIRVPSLDGTVAPVPSPKLNLDDSELRNALGALADLDGDPAEQSGDELKVASAVFKPSLHQAEDSTPAIIAEPIAIPEPIPEEAVDQQGQQTESASPLSELANAEYAIPIVEPEPNSRQHFYYIVILLIIGIAIFVVGFFVGRATQANGPSAEAIQPANEVAVDDQQPKPVDTIGEDEVAAQIYGKVTYETGTGEQRRDNGARILVLPLDGGGASSLSADGFRVGATDAEQKAFAADVRAVGGRFVVTDSEGAYSIRGLDVGNYGMLIGSRFQSRDEATSTDPEIFNFLSKYIDNAERVLGRVQYTYQEVVIAESADEEGNLINRDFSLE